MKSTLVLFIVFNLFLGAYCWGADGHQIIGQIASAFITQPTQEAIAPILGQWTLANISTWPDNYDHTDGGSWSEQNHFVDLPSDALHFEYSACFPPALEYPGCVITAITNYTEILKQHFEQGTHEVCDDDDDTEPCALSFLTHFIGDSHQPLHVSFAVDLGGNEFNVEYDNSCTEVHAVWDTRLIYTYEDENDLYWDGMADQMIGWLNEYNQTLREFTAVTRPDLWGSETFLLARFVPYNMSPGTVNPAHDWLQKINYFIQGYFDNEERIETSSCDAPYTYLGYNYYQKNIKIVFEQLAKSGVRLAWQLNTIYDPDFTGF